MQPELSRRLEQRGIQLLGETPGFAFFSRDNFVALVERRGAAFGSIGSTGVMTPDGLCYLVWREAKPFLAGRACDRPAEPGEVEALQSFSADLAAAFEPPV